jgi:O-antigen/teichoic acid export membrane protein
MAKSSNTVAGKILHNSIWFGMETVLEAVAFLGTSIAVARYLGPDKLGYFVYINFFVITITRTGGSGIASATRKYMSEFLGLDNPGAARAIYDLAFRYQLIASCAIAAVGVAAVLLFGDRHYRLMSSLLLISIVPGLMSCIPAQANQALEDVAPNSISAFFYLISWVVGIALTVHFKWDLVGIAGSLFAGRTIEVVIRTIPLHARLRSMPLEPLERDLVRRVRRYCVQGVGIQLLSSLVWDRSEVLFLKHYSSLAQVAFYSVSFTLTGNLLTFPRIFTGATGISLMVEATREPGRIRNIVNNASRVLLLAAIPVHLGAAAIAGQALAFVYGDRYLGAIPAVIVAAMLSIPRAFQEIPDVLLRAADRQREILVWFSITGVLNLGLDWYLIPRYGSTGAAWGNGLAQAFGIIAIWRQARRFYDFSFPVWNAVRLTTAGLVMGCGAWYVVRRLPGLPGLAASVAAAALIYLILVKLLHGLDASDRERLAPIGNRLPGPARRAYLALLAFATPATT